MPNDATQNPTNRWARNSGVGTAGISSVVPTRAEAQRGLRPYSIEGGGGVGRGLALGLVAVLGAVMAGAFVWRSRQPQDLPTRVLRKVRMR